ALIYDQLFHLERVVDAATITKLTRNSLLVLVVPLMSYYYHRRLTNHQVQGVGNQPKWYRLIPLFVLGFIGMAILRTVGDAGVANNGAAFGQFNSEQWRTVWQSLNQLSTKI